MKILSFFKREAMDKRPLSPKSSDEDLLGAYETSVTQEDQIPFSGLLFYPSRYIEQCILLKYQRRTLWVNVGLVLLTLVTAFVAILSYRQGLLVDKATNRPYLNFDLASSKLVLVDDFQKTRKISPQKLETFIVNVGNRPAHFKVTDIKYKGYPNLLITPEENAEGVIFPNQKVRLGWIILWDEEGEDYRKWVNEKMDPITWCVFCDVQITISYDILGASMKDSYFTTLASEYAPSKEGRIMKSEYSFRIIDAR